MQTIQFATSNLGKISSLSRQLDPKRFLIVQCKIDLPEIQATTAEDIVRQKALHASKIVTPPLLVHDSALHIEALNGFPGPYIKYVGETLGISKLVDLLRNQANRKCSIVKSLAYVNEAGTVKVFNHTYLGSIAKEVSPFSNAKQWSDLWTIFVPIDYSKPLSMFTEVELETWEKAKDNNSEFVQLNQWLQAKNN